MPRDAYLRSPAARWAAVVALAVIAFFSVFKVEDGAVRLPYRIDLDVYRIGGQVWLRGEELYGTIPTTWLGDELPFTYPPFAAMLFSPLAFVPLEVANVAFTVASIILLGVVVWVVLRALSTANARDAAWLAVPPTAVFLLADPMRHTLGYGQINLFLLALVVVDLLAFRGKRWQGALVGLALVIKLTPAVFLAYFLMRRDWRALAVAVGSAVAYTGIGFLLAPRDSVRYWTHTLINADRIGPLEGTFNQSINGVLRRIDLPSTASTVVWFALCAVIGLAVLALLHALFTRNRNGSRDPEAFAVMAIYMLLASPVSWMHHWVWAFPAVMVAAGWWLRRSTAWPAGAALVVAAVAIFSWDIYLGWSTNPIPAITNNAYVIWGVAWLVATAWRAWSRRSESPRVPTA